MAERGRREDYDTPEEMFPALARRVRDGVLGACSGLDPYVFGRLQEAGKDMAVLGAAAVLDPWAHDSVLLDVHSTCVALEEEEGRFPEGDAIDWMIDAYEEVLHDVQGSSYQLGQVVERLESDLRDLRRVRGVRQKMDDDFEASE